MREILFRGKRIDNGEWIYGSFCMDALEQKNGLCGVDGFIRLYDFDKGKMQMYEVDRNTVGQYTGLTDKNGMKIFEGDIVLIPDFTHGVALNYEQPTSKWVVKWYEKTARFSIDYMNVLPYDFTKSEVIGNIYDNPELLEG